jgi:hypothetical protein
MNCCLFCTSYFDQSSQDGALRYRRWLEYYSQHRRWFGADRIALIDDGSPRARIDLPVAIVSADQLLPGRFPRKPALFRFEQHLGRSDVFRFPGWWRSFTFSVSIARRYGFDKLIHIESDAFVLSARMAGHMRSLDRGWTAFWCPRYNRPESAIQVICRDSFDELVSWHERGVEFWSSNVCAERTLPFTHVCADYIGDRYGEYRRDIPAGADFSAQTGAEMIIPDLVA